MHGHNPGSVRLGGQRHPVRVPRVRGPAGESRLAAYEQLHGSPGEMDDGLFRKVLLGISCRDYEAAVEAVPGAIGLSKSTVSREFKKATAAKLKEFQERDLSGYDVVALVLDGKSFAEDEMVVALVVTSKGDKVFLGFVQTDTENAVVIPSFLRSLAVYPISTKEFGKGKLTSKTEGRNGNASSGIGWSAVLFDAVQAGADCSGCPSVVDAL